MSRVGRDLRSEVAVRVGRYVSCGVVALARIGGRYEPYWLLFAVWRGCCDPCRWPS